jgi:hypothetical protein
MKKKMQLMPEEELLYQTRPHWITFYPAIGWLTFTFLCLSLAVPLTP